MLPPCSGLELMRTSVLSLEYSGPQLQNATAQELYPTAWGGHVSFLGKILSRLPNKIRGVSSKLFGKLTYSEDVYVHKACSIYSDTVINVRNEASIYLNDSCANSDAYCFTGIPWQNERTSFAQHLRTTWRANASSLGHLTRHW